MRIKAFAKTALRSLLLAGAAVSVSALANGSGQHSNNYGFKGHHGFHGFQNNPDFPGFAPYVGDHGPYAFKGFHRKGKGFVYRMGGRLFKDGRPFRFAGANNYYPMYKSQAMVDSLLEDAAEAEFGVMRMWGFSVVNSPDLSDAVHSGGEGVYFHYWDAETGAPAFNDGESGLEHLDYILAKAAELNVKVVFPLTNNWSDFGGMDQMVRWRENQLAEEGKTFYHSDFYTDDVIKQWYKDWVEHLLNRTNTITGVVYKDDPTIMLWELANEPRCGGSGVYPKSDDCSVDTLTDWADEMSTFIKSVDRKHLVSVGDEGFFCDPVTQDEDGNDVWPHWTANCNEGVDTVALAKLKNIDLMSFHAYPNHWGTDSEWTVEYIKRHLKEGFKIGKPVMMGEFGWADQSTRNAVFKEWTDTFYRYGGAGALYWILSSEQDDGVLYPDWDGYTVYCPSPVCSVMTNFSKRLKTRQFYFAPIADHESGNTEFETPVSFDVLANDIAYGMFNKLSAKTIDLDPTTDVVDSEVTVEGGVFSTDAEGIVTFTPVDGFVGEATINYIARDWRRVPTNEATISVLVKALPGAPFQMYSFESGLEGWASSGWADDIGVATQSDVYSTEGSYSLFADVDAGGWFQATLPEPLNLSDGYETITFDINVDDESGGSWVSVALQLGDAWDWCEGTGEWISNGESTYVLDLLTLSCETPDLTKVQTILMHFNGDAHLDNIWANGHQLSE